jgi:sugar phosphate isomerase/epimerase
MPNNMKLGSADWNLWPISMEYEKTFPVFKRSGIRNLELGIYQPSTELTTDNCKRISHLASVNEVAITAALFSLTPNRWPDGAFSNQESSFLSECAIFLQSLDNLGVKYANIWTGADSPGADREEATSTLKELNALAKSFSGVVSIEYKADTIFPDGQSLAEQLSDFTHLKVLIDTGHAFALEEDVVNLIKDLHSRNLLGALHLGDAVAGDSDSDLPCGRVHDFTEILEILAEINYSGSANFDLYGAAVDESGPGPLSILDESLEYVNRTLRVGA